MMRPAKYLQLVFPIFSAKRTKEIFAVNPTVTPIREEATEVKFYVFEYDAVSFKEYELASIDDCVALKNDNKECVHWINIDGLRKDEIEKVCKHFDIHPLLMEDILSIGQRPKIDEIDNRLFVLLNMLYFNNKTSAVETEQISIALGDNFVITFQEDANRDVFNSLRDRLRFQSSKIRQSKADYLCYSLIDMIVDHYYVVLEGLGEKIELLEEEIIRVGNTRSLVKITMLRKELIVLKRNVSPVRDLVNILMRSESNLLEERTTKYFKDVYDHIVQANDLVENYRDMMTSLQDLYLNKVNLRMNEVMKVMAIVTCLMAPATVIGGIFGMNFDVIPLLHQHRGFYIAVAGMFIIPAWMLWVFKKRGWF